jgi:acetyltransferase-like isoleucine patch superfamily enzyme
MTAVPSKLEQLNVRVRSMHMAAGPVYVEAPVDISGIVYSCCIGRYSCLGSQILGGLGSLTTIGRYCLAAAGSQIGIGGHPTDWLSTHFFQYRECFGSNVIDHDDPTTFVESKATTIGSDTWIGANAFIKSGIVVGPGAIVGAGAVVTKDVPAYAIVGGAPAKTIRYRFSEQTIERLLKTRWWELDHEVISTLPFSNIEKCLDVLETLSARDSTRREPSYIELAKP